MIRDQQASYPSLSKAVLSLAADFVGERLKKMGSRVEGRNRVERLNEKTHAKIKISSYFQLNFTTKNAQILTN